MNFKPHINVDYPKNNNLIFEEWFFQNYNGCDTDRELVPVHFTSFLVNNNYGNDAAAMAALQGLINSLDRDKKYFCICQYDDGVCIDWEGKDVLEFNMSKNVGVPIPLLCQPHPYVFSGEKKYLLNFIGSRTHPIRDSAQQYQGKEGCYISYDQHPIEKYCEIMYQSMFTLCYRGYGANSFRLAEAIQYGSIPVYVSDEFIIPWRLDFSEFGLLVEAKDSNRIVEILEAIPSEEIIRKQDNLKTFYEHYYTYEANLKLIIKYLENEQQSTPIINI